jgi:hypothetical protein
MYRRPRRSEGHRRGSAHSERRTSARVEKTRLPSVRIAGQPRRRDTVVSQSRGLASLPHVAQQVEQARSRRKLQRYILLAGDDDISVLPDGVPGIRVLREHIDESSRVRMSRSVESGVELGPGEGVGGSDSDVLDGGDLAVGRDGDGVALGDGRGVGAEARIAGGRGGDGGGEGVDRHDGGLVGGHVADSVRTDSGEDCVAVVGEDARLCERRSPGASALSNAVVSVRKGQNKETQRVDAHQGRPSRTPPSLPSILRHQGGRLPGLASFGAQKS